MSDEKLIYLERYEPGLLTSFCGNNVDCWHEVIKEELEAAHKFYQEQFKKLVEDN